MVNLRKLGPKTLQIMRFSVNFWTSFRTPPSGCFVTPLMFFDALKVPGPSQSDPGSIWETSFFDQNFHIKSTSDVDLKWSCAPARCLMWQIWGYSPIEHALKYFWLNGQPKRLHNLWEIWHTSSKNWNFHQNFLKKSFSGKFKTSPALTPNYSIEHRKYALRVI